MGPKSRASGDPYHSKARQVSTNRVSEIEFLNTTGERYFADAISAIQTPITLGVDARLHFMAERAAQHGIFRRARAVCFSQNIRRATTCPERGCDPAPFAQLTYP